MNNAMKDEHLEGYYFGKQANDDVLLLVVATLTPAYFDDAPPQSEDGSPLFEAEDGMLTDAGKKYVATRLERLAYALTRPFNDDDCSYGYEYAEGNMNPLRFVSGTSAGRFLRYARSLFRSQRLPLVLGSHRTLSRHTRLRSGDPRLQ